MKSVHLIVSGEVQGVGFRYFARNHALALNLKGLIHNKPDGTLEITAQGEKEKLEKFIAECKKGPYHARIKKIEVLWNKKAPFSR